MKPYSTALRQKILETKQKNNQSTQQLANRFGVSYSFVYMPRLSNYALALQKKLAEKQAFLRCLVKTSTVRSPT